MLNFLPVAAAAAAAAAVAANGNCNFGLKAHEAAVVLGGGYPAIEGAAAQIESAFTKTVEKSGVLDLNSASDILTVAAHLLSGSLASGGGGIVATAGAGGGGAQDPSVSTTQVTIPKDVSIVYKSEVRNVKFIRTLRLKFICSTILVELKKHLIFIGEGEFIWYSRMTEWMNE